MKFTEKQFEKIGDIYMDDLPFGKQGLKFFNSLPENLQGEILQCGPNDTVVRENLFKFIVDNQFGMTIDQYYKSDIFQNYMKNRNKMMINYSYLNTDDDIESNINKIVLFDNEYNGFESFFDFDRDMDEVFSFQNMKIPSEFTGKIKVKIEYFPSDEDINQMEYEK